MAFCAVLAQWRLAGVFLFSSHVENPGSCSAHSGTTRTMVIQEHLKTNDIFLRVPWSPGLIKKKKLFKKTTPQ